MVGVLAFLACSWLLQLKFIIDNIYLFLMIEVRVTILLLTMLLLKFCQFILLQIAFELQTLTIGGTIPHIFYFLLFTF